MRYLPSDIVTAFLDNIPESQIFTVTFIKKDDTVRRMVCRRGVKKHLAGGESTIADHENLVAVHETRSVSDTDSGYRCFDKTRVISLHGNGMLLEMRSISGEE